MRGPVKASGGALARRIKAGGVGNKILVLLVGDAGFEPTAFGSGAKF